VVVVEEGFKAVFSGYYVQLSLALPDDLAAFVSYVLLWSEVPNQLLGWASLCALGLVDLV